MSEQGERDLITEFDAHYALVEQPPMIEAERSVIGADYGATSFTTRRQADLLASELELEPHHHLLDVGSGTGWPGIYLAAAHGCQVTLSDVPLEGLHVARRRIERDALDELVSVVSATGESLPFRSESFDVVSSSDVFC